MRRRIDILLSIAEQLLDYHRHNKVYKDLCPDFINIHITKDKKVKAILAPTKYIALGFENMFVFASVAAPEIANKISPNTPMSDCYTFAIIAYELLALCHPFIGDNVINHKIDIKDAYFGKLPWIDNTEDTSNRLTYRKCDSFFTTNEIRELFTGTFVTGKDSPIDRPAMYRWVDALHDAKFHLHHCNKCNTDYLHYENDCCPFCFEEPKPIIDVLAAQLDKKLDMDIFDFSDIEMDLHIDDAQPIVVSDKETVVLTTKQLMIDTINVKNMLSVKASNNSVDTIDVVIEPLNGYVYHAANLQRQMYAQKISNATKVSFSRKNPKSLVLALNELDKPQRVFIVRLKT